MVKNNGISSAIGKYQFIQATLKEAIKGLGLSGDEKFTPEVQDKLALWLLKNRTSFDEWVTGSGDSAKFQNELASQWASVPNTSGKSAYAGDGVNNATAEGKRLIGLL
jgi:muramidase (phage lysozyme)